jgi:ABC-type Fe3+ transport system permease subunit
MNILRRLIIIVVAGVTIWQFSDSFSLNVKILTGFDAAWHTILDALSGMVGTVCAVIAIILAVLNKHLLTAAIIAGLAIVFCYLPPVIFLFGILIYGF